MIYGAKSTCNVIKGVARPLAVHDTICPGWNVEINNVLPKLARVNKSILNGGGVFGNRAFNAEVVGRSNELRFAVSAAKWASGGRVTSMRSVWRALAFGWKDSDCVVEGDWWKEACT